MYVGGRGVIQSGWHGASYPHDDSQSRAMYHPLPSAPTLPSEFPSPGRTFTVIKNRGEVMGIEFEGSQTAAVQGGTTLSKKVTKLEVKRVFPGSPAMRAGVPTKWRVYSVNGELAQSESVIAKQRDVPTVELVLYPPGEVGDYLWLHIHLHGFYKAYDPSLDPAVETQRWWGQTERLLSHLVTRYPHADTSWLQWADLEKAVEVPMDRGTLERYPDLAGAAADSIGTSLGFSYDAETRTWKKEESFLLMLLVGAVCLLVPIFLCFRLRATFVYIQGGLALLGSLYMVLSTRRQCLVFDDIKRELRCGSMRCAPVWYFLSIPLTAVPYSALPDVVLSTSVYGCRVRVNGMMKMYYTLPIQGTQYILAQTELASVAVSGSDTTCQAFIDARRALVR